MTKKTVFTSIGFRSRQKSKSIKIASFIGQMSAHVQDRRRDDTVSVLEESKMTLNRQPTSFVSKRSPEERQYSDPGGRDSRGGRLSKHIRKNRAAIRRPQASR